MMFTRKFMYGSLFTMEPLYNEPLYNEVPTIMNDILQPVKCMEQNPDITNTFSRSLALRIIGPPLHIIMALVAETLIGSMVYIIFQGRVEGTTTF